MASLLITPDNAYVVCSNIEAPRIEQEERLLEQGYMIQSFPWYDDQEQQRVKALTRNGRVGCDAAFPGTQEISKELNPLRYALTPWEIERYPEVGYLTSKALEETAATIEPGHSVNFLLDADCPSISTVCPERQISGRQKTQHQS